MYTHLHRSNWSVHVPDILQKLAEISQNYHIISYCISSRRNYFGSFISHTFTISVDSLRNTSSTLPPRVNNFGGSNRGGDSRHGAPRAAARGSAPVVRAARRRLRASWHRDPQFWGSSMHCHNFGETLDGSFSAVSQPLFVTNYSFWSKLEIYTICKRLHRFNRKQKFARRKSAIEGLSSRTLIACLPRWVRAPTTPRTSSQLAAF